MANTVVIVDDSLTVRMDLHEAFEAGGFRTVLCATGTEARSALSYEKFDVVVLDVLLPDADGVELLREVRARPEHQEAVVILLSSETEVKDRVHGLRTGADEYVGKPYDAHFVVARSRALLRSRGSPVDSTQCVLVVDDSATFREELREALQEAGYGVLTAASGEEGLRLAADRCPSAVIVDGVLPGIDGATVIRRIRLDATLRNLPCLLLTASDDYATELQILDAGADAFVRKQENLAVVLAKLAAVLRQSAEALPIRQAGSVHGPKKILVVDADQGYLRTVDDLLREDGYDVVVTNSADDALIMLAAQPVDCVVLALDLPGVDARQTCDRVKSVPALRDTPLIMVGVQNGEALLGSLAAGADDYVRKSDGPGTLRAHIRAHLRRKQLQDESRRIREELLRREMEAAEERAARELAETRARLVEELEWRNRELEAFSGSVSHDLRSPLQTILSFSEVILEEQHGELDGQTRMFMERIQAAAGRMAGLIDSLLMLARANRGEVRRARVDISALADEVVEELRQRDPTRSVRVTVAPGMTAEGDAELIRVVLVNLVGNAWKFTSRTSEPCVEIGCVQRDDGIAYFVRDNGAGFPAQSAEQLFRPFGRLHSTAEFPGTGIGLTTAQRIVDRHGGRIWAESEQGHGATFSFTLPVIVPPAERGGR